MPNISQLAGFFLQHFRFHLEPKGPLRMPAYNKDNVIRGGFRQRVSKGSADRARVREVELKGWIEQLHEDTIKWGGRRRGHCAAEDLRGGKVRKEGWWLSASFVAALWRGLPKVETSQAKTRMLME